MKRETTQPIIQDMKKKGRTVCSPDNNENNVNADDEMSKSSLKKGGTARLSLLSLFQLSMGGQVRKECKVILIF